VIGTLRPTAPSFMLEMLPTEPFLSASQCCVDFAVSMRLSSLTNSEILLADELFASLYRYIGSTPAACPDNGTDPRIEIKKTPSISSRDIGGTRDYTAVFRYIYTVSSTDSGSSDSSDGIYSGGGRHLPRICLTVGKRKINIESGGVYNLISAEGLESTDGGVSMYENVARDGSFITSLYMKKRTIRLKFDFAADAMTDQRREYLISSFKVTSEGVLRATRGDVTRYIDFAISDIKYETEKYGVTVTMVLLCADPFFYDESPKVCSLASCMPLLTFPFNSVADAGITASSRRYTYDFTVNNTGHTDSGIMLTLSAIGLKVTNPTVSCNGEFIRIIDELETGDVYKVDTDPMNAHIEKNGVDSYDFDRRSVFFTLPPGESVISIGAEIGLLSLDASFSCTMRYYGI